MSSNLKNKHDPVHETEGQREKSHYKMGIGVLPLEHSGLYA